MRYWWVVMALAIGVSLAPGAHADELADILSGKTVPLTLQLKDLNEQWRRFNTTGQLELGPVSQIFGAIFGGSTSPYFTNGRTVQIGGELYLVAYRANVVTPNLLAVMMSSSGPPQPTLLTPETRLHLSLISLRSAGSLTDIRPFNLQEVIQESQAAVQAAASASGG